VIDTYLGFRPGVDPGRFSRVLVTLADPRRRVLNGWAAAQLAPLADVTFATTIHKSEAFPKARANGQTVFDYAASHPAGTAARSVKELEQLVGEVVGHER